MAVLYQKYRPQTFSEVIGQDPIVQTLKNAAAAGELAHAYMFTGSRGVGKTTIARLLAKAANCQNLKKGDPCGTCDICTAIAAGISLDVIEIDAASHTGVDNVRELIDHAQYRPTVMSKKVFIVDEVHMLSKAAFNALLKTLEEPPEHAMFILATTDIEKVPDTILSRTQRFDFKRIKSAEMTEALQAIVKDQKLTLPAGVVEAVVGQAEGSMRDALSRLNMIASMSSETLTLKDAERLLGITSLETVQKLVSIIIAHDAASLPDFFDAAFAGGTDPAVFNRSVLHYLRQILNAKLTGQQVLEADETLTIHVGALSTQQIIFMIRLFLRSYKELSHAPSPELPLLLAAIEASLQGVTATNAQPATHATAAAPVVAAPTVAVQQPQSDPTILKTSDEPKKTVNKLDSENIETANGPLDADVTLEEIQTWWPEVISRVKIDNSPIATLLKNSPIIEVINGKITVAVRYLFHKEHFDNKKHNAMITQTITAVSGKHLVFRSVIKNDAKQSTIVQTVESLNDALKVFGGELVE